VTQQTPKDGRAGNTTPAGARVVVVGAGFSGGSFLQNLPATLKEPGETLLVERGEEYAFVPLIHEVATGRIHPDSIRTPITPSREDTYGFLKAEVNSVDLRNKTLLTSSGPVKYRYLVLAPGSIPVAPPEDISEHFQTFWRLDDALRLRSSLNEVWRASMRRESLPRGRLTVAIVGGGATGVELAAEIAVLFEYLKKRTIRTPAEEPRVVLVEKTDRLMGWLDRYFHEVALEELSRLGVEVRLNAPVTAGDEAGVETGGEWLPAATRVWVTGIRANPLVRNLPGEHDPSGRAYVDGHLTLPNYPEVYVPGDGGVHRHPHPGSSPPTAAAAVQQGPYVAHDIGLRIGNTPEKRRRPFEFFDRGYLVSLGPESAVGDPLGFKLRGHIAQALYRSVLLYYMESRERFLTGADWAMERALGRVGFDLGSQRSAVSSQRKGL
jgi:NADH dehydrogenase